MYYVQEGIINRPPFLSTKVEINLDYYFKIIYNKYFFLYLINNKIFLTQFGFLILLTYETKIEYYNTIKDIKKIYYHVSLQNSKTRQCVFRIRCH